MANYPASLPGLSTANSNSTPSSGTHPSLHNTVNDEVNSIAATLGTNPTYLRGGGARSLLSLGCVGNGSTDDEVALQAALDGQRSDARWLDGEAKTYGLSKPIVLGPSAKLRQCTLKALAGFAPADANGAMVMTSQGTVLSFTAAAATDVFTTPSNHSIPADDIGVVFKGASLPTGITAGRVYYSRDRTATTFKVASTRGGSAVNLTADGSGTVYCEVLSLNKVYLSDVFIDGQNITGLNGAAMSLQQQSELYKLRIDNCPGVGLVLNGQQAVFVNFESIHCTTALALEDASFMYFYGFNAENYDRGIHARPAQVFPSAGLFSSLFKGVHFEMNDGSGYSSPASVAVDLESSHHDVSFDDTNVTGNVNGQRAFYIHTGSAATSSYSIRNVRFITGGTTARPTGLDDTDRGLALDAWDDLRNHIHEIHAPLKPTSDAFTDPGPFTIARLGGGYLKYGSQIITQPTVQSRPGSTQTGDQYLWRDSSGNEGSGVNKGGYFHTKKTSAPADGDLVNSQLMWYWDATAGAMVVKGKKSDGTVVSTTLGSGGGVGPEFVRQPDYVTGQYYPCCETLMGGLAGTGTQTVNKAMYLPFWVYASQSFDRIACYITANGTSGSVTRLGVLNDSNGVPGTVVFDAGTVATDAGAPVIAAVTISQTLAAGRYWAAVVAQTASPTYRRVLPLTPMAYLNSVFDGAVFNNDGVSGALGNNPSVASNALNPPLVALRAS